MPRDKLEGCRRFNVDIMIDDKPKAAYFLVEQGIPVLLFDTPYNQDVSGSTINGALSIFQAKSL